MNPEPISMKKELRALFKSGLISGFFCGAAFGRLFQE
jgi:hypothetical protein